jgi:hypothetical protein
MYFFDKLELLELLRQDDVKTYRAADKITGQDYLLHWLPPDNSPQLARIMTLLNGLDEDGRKLIIEVGRRYNRPYLITQHPPSFGGLESWLNAVKDFLGTTSLEKKGAWKIPAEFIDKKTPSPATPPASDPGEFTRLMQTLPTPAPVHPAPVPPPIVSPQQPASAAPGEFTLFMRQAESPPPPAKPVTPAGEFTRMMQANTAPEPARSERVMRPAPRHEAGEFTRLFTLPTASDSRDRPAPPQTGHIPPEPAQPGEFTRLFQSPAAQPTPLLPGEDPFSGQPYSPVDAPSEFTRDFGPQPVSTPEQLSGSSERATQVFARPVFRPEPAPRAPEGPGEYTRMFGTPAVATGDAPRPSATSAPAVAPSAPPAAVPQTHANQTHGKRKPEPGPWIFVAILAMLAICAIALIVYFALKK